MKKKPVITDPPIIEPEDTSKGPGKNSREKPNEKVFYDDVDGGDEGVSGSDANEKQENTANEDNK